MEERSMAKIETAKVQTDRDKFDRTFIGRCWMNTVKTGKLAGQPVFNIRFDRGVKLDGVTSKDHMEMWPNTKRDGKKDADYRVSILTLKE